MGSKIAEQKNKSKLYDLYCNGDKVGTCLFSNEVQEIKREYKKYYKELGIEPEFESVEV